MNILVTGAAGFIGSRYVRGLLASDAPGAPRVTVLDALTYAGSTAISNSATPGWSSCTATSATRRSWTG